MPFIPDNTHKGYADRARHEKIAVTKIREALFTFESITGCTVRDVSIVHTLTGKTDIALCYQVPRADGKPVERHVDPDFQDDTVDPVRRMGKVLP